MASSNQRLTQRRRILYIVPTILFFVPAIKMNLHELTGKSLTLSKEITSGAISANIEIICQTFP
jgi:hypothetical protein